ncbi:MAG: GntR family transcriptional regulator [Ferruginibacter sp.]|nr:GntR family transcriptional regulator [Cytophagales bacterium]
MEIKELSKHKRIYNDLKQKIVSGEYPFGFQLLPEIELSRQLSISRPTVSKVYQNLQQEKLVEKRIGAGTFVIYQRERKAGLLIGLLLPGSGESEIFETIGDQIMKKSQERSFHCLWVGASVNEPAVRRQYIEKVCQGYVDRKVDGVLFSPLERTEEKDEVNDRICAMLARANIPLVLIDRDTCSFPARSHYDLVSIDNFHAGFVMTQHLLDQQCRQLIFLHRPFSAPSVDMRIAGHQYALTKAGLPPTASQVLIGEPDEEAFVATIPVGSPEVGIICANDATAAALMSTLKKRNVTIGEDLVLVGFDDIRYAKHLLTPLTTYRQPCEAIGAAAVEILLAKIENPNRTPVQVHLLGEIVVRESSFFRKAG